MKLGGIHTRSIRRTDDGKGATILDQRDLPWKITWVELRDAATAERAIREMWTRGAPLIGATAAYGLALALAQRGIEGGAEAHASSIAAEYLSRSKQELLDLKASDLAGLVDSRMKRWEATRPWEVADKIAAIGAAGGVEHEA